ncbi:16S rRNA (guanine(527)-N(7))-methyltransferase RsmG [Moraxella caviae]|uniref:Ribosomal RNA small subunit methyltransferase G n=1 Tax=Moraxella caviae TaxID=34060 RepID=A0A1T0A5R5_9GAMM|nr:16S rRNA (guanine(527)-N(7))-methyltransferase RsmG [Moraxella caviae]OOR91064.1 16S rRNA (guanine(527)-N(7))-methyltransferase RsmG [Moraxella caviae]STZ14243.1 Ribosomal RNA small subunit methyltransferase G [Moraxella caviae]VEW13132.1 Ribosomal RNA small subunit methyltransferase G [Moraxella caviae]VEW13179.1 Ribosomal RNA small subunit methyltransferase G [Moraxella caviae]
MVSQAGFFKIGNHADKFAVRLQQAANALGLAMSDAQCVAILRYLDGLLLWGKAYNLTAITDPNEALIKHIFDCMAIVPKLPFADKSGVSVLDIGTGAGLPAVLVAILRPDWQITALDSNQKKIRFIRQIVGELALENLTPVASRIENFTGEFDVITSRAFASLDDFVALGAPYLAAGGKLSAMKAKAPELDDKDLSQPVMFADKAWQCSVIALNVPELADTRCLVELDLAD